MWLVILLYAYVRYLFDYVSLLSLVYVYVDLVKVAQSEEAPKLTQRRKTCHTRERDAQDSVSSPQVRWGFNTPHRVKLHQTTSCHVVSGFDVECCASFVFLNELGLFGYMVCFLVLFYWFKYFVCCASFLTCICRCMWCMYGKRVGKCAGTRIYAYVQVCLINCAHTS